MNKLVVFDYDKMGNPSPWITQRYGPDLEAPVEEAPRVVRARKRKLKAVVPAEAPGVAAEIRRISDTVRDEIAANNATIKNETTWDARLQEPYSFFIQPAVRDRISLTKGNREYVPPAIFILFEKFMENIWKDTTKRAARQTQLRKYVVPTAGAADRFLEPVAQGMLHVIYGNKPEIIQGIMRHYGLRYEKE